jgi:hypothetical protein
MLAGATRQVAGGEKVGMGKVKQDLTDVVARRLSGLKYKMVTHFILAANVVRDDIR